MENKKLFLFSNNLTGLYILSRNINYTKARIKRYDINVEIEFAQRVEKRFLSVTSNITPNRRFSRKLSKL